MITTSYNILVMNLTFLTPSLPRTSHLTNYPWPTHNLSTTKYQCTRIFEQLDTNLKSIVHKGSLRITEQTIRTAN